MIKDTGQLRGTLRPKGISIKKKSPLESGLGDWVYLKNNWADDHTQ